MNWFTTSSSDLDRSTYRARLINEAIEQNRRGYQSKPDAVMTRFCSQYWAYVVEEFPELKMDDPGLKGISSRSDWRYLKNPALGKGRHLIHKWPQGVVDLQIDYAGDFVDEIRAANRAILVDGIDVINTGKSASIQIQVPAVNWRSEFASQKETVRAGLAAAVRLLVISPKIAWQRQKDGNKR